jgi:hypothetical protein
MPRSTDSPQRITPTQFENLKAANPFLAADLRRRGFVSYSATPGTTVQDTIRVRQRATHEEVIPDGMVRVVDENPFESGKHRQAMDRLTPEQRAAIVKIAGNDIEKQRATLATVAPTWTKEALANADAWKAEGKKLDQQIDRRARELADEQIDAVIDAVIAGGAQ